MTPNPEQFPIDAAAREALPASFEVELRDLDDRLARRAAAASMPRGLVERVHEASVRDLPRPVIRRNARSWWRQARPARPMVTFGWGRAALAASIGLAAVVGLWFLQAPPPRVDPVGPVVMDISFLEVDPMAAYDDRVAHVLDTATMESRQLESELEALVADLEM